MATAIFAGTLNVSAEGVKDVFDAKYYADTNADLKAIYGYDEKALYNHYITYGIKEGRCGSQTFNVAAYRMAYPDLQAAFGDNWDAYVNHYFTVGKAEGSIPGAIAVYETMEFDYYNWAVGFESPSALQKSIKKNTVHGETTTTTDCTFTVEVNGVKYTNCTYHLDMEYTKFNSRPYMNATITVCVPIGYNDLAAAVVYDNKVVAYIPMP